MLVLALSSISHGPVLFPALYSFKGIALKGEYLTSGMGRITKPGIKIICESISLAFFFSHMMPRQITLPFMEKTIDEA